jgi:hypothetical protein
MVVYTYNLRYFGGKDQENHDSILAWIKVTETISQETNKLWWCNLVISYKGDRDMRIMILSCP